MKALLSTTFFLLFFVSAFALTWDEPWHEKVVKESDAFFLGKVVRSEGGAAVYVQVLKNISGRKLPAEIKISDFYLLKICSRSGDDGIQFRLDGVDSCYFFLKISNDTFKLATPTSGFAPVINGKVVATYRHSYHQASVPIELYEQSQSAIFNAYHGKTYDVNWVNEFIKIELSKRPAGFEKAEIQDFFNQHVALELIYHLKLSEYFTLLQPFINHEENRHNQISAARALKWHSQQEINQMLLKIIKSDSEDDFLKVICVWSLQETKTKKMQDELKSFVEKASEGDSGFGGNIMDNRVCTHMPTVKDAISELITK
nr:hypothetical protein [uncultured Lacibacter sp.]